MSKISFNFVVSNMSSEKLKLKYYKEKNIFLNELKKKSHSFLNGENKWKRFKISLPYGKWFIKLFFYLFGLKISSAFVVCLKIPLQFISLKIPSTFAFLLKNIPLLPFCLKIPSTSVFVSKHFFWKMYSQLMK